MTALTPPRVRVEDALSYLDQVKSVFSRNAIVYTQFLDVMKDFKAQSLDTHGVITRVAHLFRGHTDLIVGFNTFLPAGFKVIIRNNIITILDPDGKTQSVDSVDTAPPDPIQDSVYTVDDDDPDDGAEEPPHVVNVEELLAEEDSRMEEEAAASQSVFPHPQAHGRTKDASELINKAKTVLSIAPFRQFVDILLDYGKTCEMLRNQIADEPMYNLEVKTKNSIEPLLKEYPHLWAEFLLFLPKKEDEKKAREIKKKRAEEPKKSRGKSNAAAAPVIVEQVPVVPAATTEDAEDAKIKEFEKTATRKMPADLCAQFSRMFDKVPRVHYHAIMKHVALFVSDTCSKKDLIDAASAVLTTNPVLRNQICATIRSWATENERDGEDVQIDFTTCKSAGASYRALPISFKRPKCSGRTALCHEVLNDTWVSFPCWSSEDTTAVSSKKSILDDTLHKIEEERYEFDMALKVNEYAIECLSEWNKRLEFMSPQEQEKFKLMDDFGVSSPALFERALRKVYGEQAHKLLKDLKARPSESVPVMLTRLNEKKFEWTTMQDHFQSRWADWAEFSVKRANESFLTSAKNVLMKALRTKTLTDQLMNLVRDTDLNRAPHQALEYPEDKTILFDVSHMITVYMEKQLTGCSKDEKKKMAEIVDKVLPDLFAIPNRSWLESEAKKMEGEGSGKTSSSSVHSGYPICPSTNTYRVLFGGIPLYLFLRIHHLICDQLGKLKKMCREDLEESKLDDKMRASSSVWQMNRKQYLKNQSTFTNYDRFLWLVKSNIQGQVEAAAFEDETNRYFGTRDYNASLIPFEVSLLTKNLVSAVADAVKTYAFSLFKNYRQKRGPSIYSPSSAELAMEDAYERAARATNSPGSTLIRFFFVDDSAPIVTVQVLKELSRQEMRKNIENEKKKDCKAVGDKISESDLSKGVVEAIKRNGTKFRDRSTSRPRTVAQKTPTPPARPKAKANNKFKKSKFAAISSSKL